MESKVLVISLICFLTYIKDGGTLTLPRGIPNNNKAVEPIDRLSEIVENTVKNAESFVDSTLDVFHRSTLDTTASNNREMEREAYSWSQQLNVYKKNASINHINISSCLGESEENLEQQYTINSNSMFEFAFRVINITEGYGKETRATINSTRLEVEEVKQKLKACGEDVECLLKMNAEIEKDMKIFPKQITDIADKTLLVVQEMKKKVNSGELYYFNTFSENGTQIFNGIISCIESKM